MRKKYYMGWVLGVLLGVVAISDMATAADDPNSKTLTLTQVLGASGVDLSGYIDSSAIYNSNGTTQFTSGTASHAYDNGANSLNVQMLELALTKAPTKGVGGALVLNAGPDANVDHSFPMSTNSYFDIQQAYVSYQKGAAKLEVGKFATLIGAEVIESPYNWNFSRSWGFEFGPYTHTGARLSYAPNSKVGLTVGVNNGWDILTAANGGKSAEAQITFKPVDPIYLSVQATAGREVAQGTLGKVSAILGTRTLINTVDSWNVNSSISIMIDAGYGEQQHAISLAAGSTGLAQTAKWWYVIPYLNYHITDQWRVALRAQYFDDRDGYRTGVAQKLAAGTVTLAYAPSASSEVRAEYRYDKSNVNAFSTKGSRQPKNNQSQAALEFIYKM